MSLLARLFGRKPDADTAPEAEAIDYKGFLITARPQRDGGQYRVSARIEREGKVHDLIRADTMASLEDAQAISLSKARQMIDEQGMRLFG